MLLKLAAAVQLLATYSGSGVSLSSAQEFVGVAPAAHPVGLLNPYSFQYNVDHPDGSQSSRVEKGDHRAVTGSYQIVGADGLQRTVNYVADELGFRAFVDSNEPGVKSGEYPPPAPAVELYEPDRYVTRPTPAPVPPPPPPPPPAPKAPDTPARRVPASHQSQIRVHHKGATFTSHVDFGPADHAHDEFGNIIPLPPADNKAPAAVPAPGAHPTAGTERPGRRPQPSDGSTKPETAPLRPSGSPASSRGQRRGHAVAPAPVLYQETPTQDIDGNTAYGEFHPGQFSPDRPLYIVGQGPVESRHPSGDVYPPGGANRVTQRGGRQLDNVNAVSGVLNLRRPSSSDNVRGSQRNERGGFPHQVPVSEQVAHSPTLYFNTANKEEEGGAIITKNNLNPPVKIFPPGSGIAQQGTPFRASVPQPQGHHPKNFPISPQQQAYPYGDQDQFQDVARHPDSAQFGRRTSPAPGQLLSVNVQPFDKRLGDVKGEYFLRGHDGQLRKVVYEADKDGFRAHVDTDEFGVVSHKPSNAVITRNRDAKYNQIQSGQLGGPNQRNQDHIYKPERPLERGPRPLLYIGHDPQSNVNRDSRPDNENAPHFGSLPRQSYVPAVFREEPAPLTTTTLPPPTINDSDPDAADVDDLKRRPVNFIEEDPLVAPLPPRKPALPASLQRVPQQASTTTRRPRQIFSPQTSQNAQSSSARGPVPQNFQKFQSTPSPYTPSARGHPNVLPQSPGDQRPQLPRPADQRPQLPRPADQRPQLQRPANRRPQPQQAAPRNESPSGGQPRISHPPGVRQDRGGRQYSGNDVTPSLEQANADKYIEPNQHDVLNIPITEPRRLVDPADHIQTQHQPGQYRQPHHGPGFGYQHTTVHEGPAPAVQRGPPQFNRLDEYQQPIRNNFAKPVEDPAVSRLSFRQPNEQYSRANSNTNRNNANNEDVPSFSFQPSRQQQVPYRPLRVNQPSASGSGQPTDPHVPGSRTPASQPFSHNKRPTSSSRPDQQEPDRQPHQTDTQVDHDPAQYPAIRAFGPVVSSPYLKVPASEAIRTGPGVDVTPAPIKHFGPPAATPLPAIFQTAPARDDPSPHRRSGFTGSAPGSEVKSSPIIDVATPNNRPDGRPRSTSSARGSRNLDPSRPLLRMYDNGVVIGGPEPQKISYDPINDEPVRQGKRLRVDDDANSLQSGYAPRNFPASIIYNSQDQESHFSDFNGQTDAPDRDARLLSETVTPTSPGSRLSRVPFTTADTAGTTLPPTAPELKAFSPANDANLMSFEVKKTTRRRRRRKQNQPLTDPANPANPLVVPALDAPPPAFSSTPAEIIPAPVPAPRDHLTLQPYIRSPAVVPTHSRPRFRSAIDSPPPSAVPTNSPTLTRRRQQQQPPPPSSNDVGPEYDTKIPFGTRLRSDQIYVPKAREITLNVPNSYATLPAVITFHNRPEDGGPVKIQSTQKQPSRSEPPPTSTEPPKRRITRRRRLKSQSITPVNPDQVYPNSPSFTPAPADFGFGSGIPQLKTPYDRPHFHSGVNANLPSLVSQRRRKSHLFNTTTNPLDVTPDLKQARPERLQEVSDFDSPSTQLPTTTTPQPSDFDTPVRVTIRPHLPGFSPNTPQSGSTESLLELVNNQPTYPHSAVVDSNQSNSPAPYNTGAVNRPTSSATQRNVAPQNDFATHGIRSRAPANPQQDNRNIFERDSGSRPRHGSEANQPQNNRQFVTNREPIYSVSDPVGRESPSSGHFRQPALSEPSHPESSPQSDYYTPAQQPTSPDLNPSSRFSDTASKKLRTPKEIGLPRFRERADTSSASDDSNNAQLKSDLASPSPYKFGFDEQLGGGRVARQEEFDGTGRVTGFYTIEDPDGRKRLVRYVADEHGFRASVVTNEQGTDNQDPAQIRIQSTSPHYVPKAISTNPDSVTVE